MAGSEEDPGPLKKYKVDFRAAAQGDLAQIREWYESRRIGLGRQFAERVAELVARLESNPESGPPVYAQVRHMLTRRFPYAVFYLIEREQVVVLGCRHHAQNPETWPKP